MTINEAKQILINYGYPPYPEFDFGWEVLDIINIDSRNLTQINTRHKYFGEEKSRTFIYDNDKKIFISIY